MRILKCKEVKDLAEGHGVEAGFKFREYAQSPIFLNDVIYCLWVAGYHLEGRAW